ncbi:MAG: cytochrome b [Burkholderiaceae bacterium]
MTAPRPYTRTAVALHWLLGIAIAATFILGLYMHELPGSLLKSQLYNWHKWAGACILALSALRLCWRLTHRPPADLAMPAWQARAAHWVHGAMYLLFFCVPLSGWGYSSAAGHPLVVFGVLPLPDFVPVDKALADALKGLHKLLTTVLGLLVIGHAAAALKHHWIDRDGLLARMAWRRALGRAP